MRRRRLHVGGHIAPRKQRAVYARVQRLDAAIHHLGKASEVVDGPHGDTRFPKGTRSAAGRDNLDAELLRQRARERHNTGLVRNRDKNTLDDRVIHRTTSTH